MKIMNIKHLVVVFLTFSVSILIVGCGGGGGSDATPVSSQDVFQPDSQGRALEVRPDEEIRDGKITLEQGDSAVIGASTFAELRQHPSGQYRPEQLDTHRAPTGDRLVLSQLWIDGVPQQRVSATQHRVDTRSLEPGIYQAKLCKDVSPQRAASWYNDLHDLGGTVESGDSSDSAEIIAAGVAGLILGVVCPEECYSFDVRVEAGDEIEPEPEPTLSVSGPSSANEGDSITLNISGTCSNWTLSGPNLNTSGSSSQNISVNVPEVESDSSVTYTLDGCGLSRSLIVQVADTDEPEPEPEPLSIRVEGPNGGSPPLVFPNPGPGASARLTAQLSGGDGSAGYLQWDIVSGPSGAQTFPLGSSNPKDRILFEWSRGGTYQMRIRAFESQQDFATGDPPLASTSFEVTTGGQ